MAGSPREQWERLQVILQNRARGGGGGFKFGGGAPIGGPAVALIALIAGGYAFSNALFNGEELWDLWGRIEDTEVGANGCLKQSTAVTGPSSTPDYLV